MELPPKSLPRLKVSSSEPHDFSFPFFAFLFVHMCVLCCGCVLVHLCVHVWGNSVYTIGAVLYIVGVLKLSTLSLGTVGRFQISM